MNSECTDVLSETNDEKANIHSYAVVDAADYRGRHTKKFGGLSAKTRPGQAGDRFLRPPRAAFLRECLPKTPAASAMAGILMVFVLCFSQDDRVGLYLHKIRLKFIRENNE
jgi:hypothetical protein